MIVNVIVSTGEALVAAWDIAMVWLLRSCQRKFRQWSCIKGNNKRTVLAQYMSLQVLVADEGVSATRLSAFVFAFGVVLRSPPRSIW